MPTKEIALEAARLNESLNVGDYVEDQVESVCLCTQTETGYRTEGP